MLTKKYLNKLADIFILAKEEKVKLAIYDFCRSNAPNFNIDLWNKYIEKNSSKTEV